MRSAICHSVMGKMATFLQRLSLRLGARGMTPLAVGFVTLMVASRLQAQIKAAPNTYMTGNGSFLAGYSGGNSYDASTHSLLFGLNGSFYGVYEDPRILSFTFNPNWVWDHDSAERLASDTGDEGVFTSVHFLNGSWLPLTVNFSVLRLTTASLSGGLNPITVDSTGLDKTLSLIWSLHKHQPGKKDRLPPLTLSFIRSSSDNRVSGILAPELTSKNTTFSATSSYTLSGFHMNGMYIHEQLEQNTPDLLNLGVPTTTSSTTQTESLGLSRTFFGNTSLSANYGASQGDVTIAGQPYKVNSMNANLTVNSNPLPRLNLNATGGYVSNVSAQTLLGLATGTLTSSTSTTTGEVPQLLLSTSQETDAATSATYMAARGLQLFVGASFDHSGLEEGIVVGDQTYGAGLIFMHTLAKGFLTLTVTPEYFTVEETINSSGANAPPFKIHGPIFSGATRYTRRMGRWQANAGLTYTQSNINEELPVPLVSRALAANLSMATRFWHEWNFTGTYTLSKTSLVGANGSLANTFSGAFTNRTWSFMGQAQFSSGYTVPTGLGLLSLEGAALPGAILTLYQNTNGYAVGGAYTRRRLQLTASYSQAGANVQTEVKPVITANSSLDLSMTYRFRRVSFRAGYRHWTLNSSSSTGLHQLATSYYLTLIRTFHLF